MAIMALLLASAVRAAPSSDAAAVVDAFHSALARGDANATSALLADDALIFEEGGAERTKAEYVAKHLPTDIEFSKSVGSTMTWRSGGSGGDVAWVASEGRLTGSYHGKAVNRVTTETVILHRTDGSWKIVHIHWSSAPRH